MTGLYLFVLVYVTNTPRQIRGNQDNFLHQSSPISHNNLSDWWKVIPGCRMYLQTMYLDNVFLRNPFLLLEDIVTDFYHLFTSASSIIGHQRPVKDEDEIHFTFILSKFDSVILSGYICRIVRRSTFEVSK